MNNNTKKKRTFTNSKSKKNSKSINKANIKSNKNSKSINRKNSKSKSNSKSNSKSKSKSKSKSNSNQNRLSKVSSNVFSHNITKFLNTKNLSQISSVSQNMRKKSHSKLKSLKPKIELINKLNAVFFLSNVHQFIQNVYKQNDIDIEYSELLHLIQLYDNAPSTNKGDIMVSISDYITMLGNEDNLYDEVFNMNDKQLLRLEEPYLMKEFNSNNGVGKAYSHVKYFIVSNDKNIEKEMEKINNDIQTLNAYNNSLEKIQLTYKDLLKRIQNIMENSTHNLRVYEKTKTSQSNTVYKLVHPMKVYAHFDFF